MFQSLADLFGDWEPLLLVSHELTPVFPVADGPLPSAPPRPPAAV